jgi:hypothetical protein
MMVEVDVEGQAAQRFIIYLLEYILCQNRKTTHISDSDKEY